MAKFWSGMLQKLSLKRNDILMLGNADNGKPEFITFENLTKDIPRRFEGLTDPAGDANNFIKDGDIWIYNGTPLTRYDRVQGYWLNLSGTGGGSTQPTIFTADVINFNGDRRNIINCNGDKNLIIKSK